MGKSIFMVPGVEKRLKHGFVRKIRKEKSKIFKILSIFLELEMSAGYFINRELFINTRWRLFKIRVGIDYELSPLPQVQC